MLIQILTRSLLRENKGPSMLFSQIVASQLLQEAQAISFPAVQPQHLDFRTVSSLDIAVTLS